MSDPHAPPPPAGWYPDPSDPTSGSQRWWNGTQWEEATRSGPSFQPDAPAPATHQQQSADDRQNGVNWPLVQRPPTKKKALPVWAVIVIGVIVALWLNGSLDKPLSNVGLNREPCVENAFGATFCGDDAERVCREIGGPVCADLGLSTEGSLTDDLESLGTGTDDLDGDTDEYP